jgi:hypothetical protein
MSRKRQPRVPACAPTVVCAADSINAIGIVRVSTAKQSDGMSPDVQQRGIEDYARRRGLHLVEVHHVHESGKDSGARPLFRSALDEAIKFGNVIFWVWDRSGRNLADQRFSMYEKFRDLRTHPRFEAYLHAKAAELLAAPKPKKRSR